MKSRRNMLLLCGAILAVTMVLAIQYLLAQSTPQPNKIDSVCIAEGLPNISTPKGSCTGTPPGTPDYIDKAVVNYGRLPQDVWEDATTKPWEVLQFIGVKPGDKVVDFLPGARPLVSMYWSRLFYKTVGLTGKVYPFYPQVGCRASHLYACMVERNPASSSNGYGIRPLQTLTGDPRWNGIDQALDVEHTTDFRNLYTIWSVGGQFNIPEQANVVWSTAHWHDLHGRVYLFDMADFLARVFEGTDTANGVLVIADYAGNPGTGFTQVDTLHRIDKEAVKAEVQKAGFILVGESMVWAKKDDDHTKPVPEESTPGVADMFILKFKKPANAPPPRRVTQQQAAGWIGARFGQVWFNADWTYQEYLPGETFYGTWYIDAEGQHILRHEFPPTAQATTGIHYLNDEKHPWASKKPGDQWAMPYEYDSSGPPHNVSLQPTHFYPPPPAGCKAAECDFVEQYSDNPNLGHVR